MKGLSQSINKFKSFKVKRFFCYKAKIQNEAFKRKAMGESLNPNSKKTLKPNAYTCLKH